MTRTAANAPRPRLHCQLARQRGVSLVETMVVCTVTAVTLGVGLPGFGALAERKRLESAAAQIETELQYARSLAVAQGRSVRASFSNAKGQGCYVIHSGGPGECVCSGDDRPALCTGGALAERSFYMPSGGSVNLRSNTGSIGFDPVKGTITPTATVRLTSRSGAGLNLVVNLMGRVRTCSPTGLAGYRAC